MRALELHRTASGLLLMLGALVQSGCDTRCVGPSCPTEDEDTDAFVFQPEEEEEEEVDLDSLRDERPDTLPLQRSCSLVRAHKPPYPAGTVQIGGSFNNWEPADMTGPDEDGFFTADVGELAPGLYPYKYIHDGNWETEVPNSTELQWDGGIENRSLRVGDCNLPALQVLTAEATADGELAVDVRYALAADGQRLDEGSITVWVGDRPITPTVDDILQIISVRASGLPEGKHTVRVTARDQAGRSVEEDTFTPLWVEPQSFDWTDGAMYLVFVDRFRNGDSSSDRPGIPGIDGRANFSGGDLLGVQQAIEEGWFTDMGISSIWLSPLYDNPEAGFQGVSDGQTYTGYHGYWPVKARAVEDRYGDSEMSAEDRLHALVDAAHVRGIRIVFDLVLNHVHEQHEYRSQHPEWFSDGCVCGSSGCGWEEKPIECWFTSYMPDLDHQNPWITEQLLDDSLWWLRRFDLDGMRIDAVKHMHRNMTVNLAHRVTSEIERGGGAEVYMVGETFTGGGAQQELTQRIGPFEMDAQFDFPYYWASRAVFASGGGMGELEGTINAGLRAWADAPMSPFSGNHDIGRLSTAIANNDDGPWGWSVDRLAAGGENVTEPWLIDTIAMALATTLTQPGVPLLYYGDEIGLAGSGDPDNRRLMSFDPYLSGNQRALLDKVQRAGRARRELRALQRGDFVPMWASQDVLAYGRVTSTDGAIVVVNRGDARTTRISVQGLFDDGVILRDRMRDGRTFTISGGELPAAMDGNDVAILAP